jgi:hypothetical protein
MDARDYALQEDTGMTHGRDLIEVCGPRSHRKPIEVSHYYAGYRVDDTPEFVESRNIEAEIVDKLSTLKPLVSEFLRMLAVHELTCVYIDRFFDTNPATQFSDWLFSTKPRAWADAPFVWPDEYVGEFVQFDVAWKKYLKQVGHV